MAYIFNATTGGLLQSLSSPYAQYHGCFGFSVAIGGGLALVGAPFDTVGNHTDAGRVEVFNAWTGALLGSLRNPSDGLEGEFGYSIALSNGRAVVGAPATVVQGNASVGRAYLFNAFTETLSATLAGPRASEQAGSQFGYSVATNGNTSIVGEPFESYPGLGGFISGSGAAYLFNRSGGLVQTLHSLRATANGEFGYSVASSGNFSIVGAPGEPVDGYPFAGDAYVFGASNGTELADLTSSTPLYKGYFGADVAISGSSSVIDGNEGASTLNLTTYEFRLPSGNLTRTVTSPDPEGFPSTYAPMAPFPSLAMSGSYVIMGISIDSDNQFGLSGRAYEFNSLSGGLLTTLVCPSSDVPYDQYFGTSIALGRSLGVVGAPGESAGGTTDAGAAYVVNASNGAELRRLVSPSAQPGGGFGYSVAIDGNLAVIGAYSEDHGGDPQSGAVYVMNAHNGALIRTLVSPNSQDDGLFGYSVGISGGLAIVGAPFESDSGRNYSGNAYVFNISTGTLVRNLSDPSPLRHAGGSFGYSVALSGDLAIVGAPGETVAGDVGAGRAEVFNVSTGAAIQNLTSPTAYVEVDGYFGYSVSIEGATVVVGAPEDVVVHHQSVGYSTGSAYVFNASTGALNQDLISPSAFSGYAIYGAFGGSVAISGNLTIVGAYEELELGLSGSQVGRAYVFNTGSGALAANMTDPAREVDGDFGYSVALEGTVAMVGAPFEEGGHAFALNARTGSLIQGFISQEANYYSSADGTVALTSSRELIGDPTATVGTHAQAGRVQVLATANGSIIQNLTSPTPQASGNFGGSVAIDRAFILVGAYGESHHNQSAAGNAYVFNATSGALIRTLSSPYTYSYGEFGYSVALNGNLAIIGAPLENNGPYVDGGNAYVFNASNGSLLQKLNDTYKSYYGEFGYSVALTDRLALVGAPYEGSTSNLSAGNAYVFNVSSGSRVQTLTSPTPRSNGRFGTSVAISGDRAVVGAPGEGSIAGYGAIGRVYTFDALTGTRGRTLQALDPAQGGEFGSCVAISGQWLLIGAPHLSGAAGPTWGFTYAYVVNASSGDLVQSLLDPSPPEYVDYGYSVAIQGHAFAVGYS